MNRNLLLDIHTHTLVSGHAYGTIREMAFAAKEKGIELLGISEHAPGIPGTCDPFYYLNLGVVPRKIYGVEIIHGCEINVLNDGRLSLEQKYIDRLDYAIVGIHRQCYENAGVVKNTENLISCMKHEKVFFVSHPDDDNTPLDYQKLVIAAKEYNVALEVNNSSLLKKNQRLNCVDNYKKMLNLCNQYGVHIIINSDAHDPSCVGDFSEADKLLNEVGFDNELILNTSIDKFKKFIHY
ncbi:MULTISPECIES: phosphatase [Clostridium]|uniref:Phosphotransferase domain-containing protein n=1 Tax=Clostridium sartagoforme AAU1 TaxID=1202534 RepID=R9BU38_9CLOT|nr:MULTISPECIES: phosphatase [Clostridium]EOR20210.1 phosphotransferase domain-containing protein [Clostridium sartagoforme AAU1]KLE15595.1 hydrolase [Clostridium sp. C8]